MSVKPRRRKCLGCKQVFTADYRNGHHQRYCAKPLCRQAGKRASQRRWRRKPENRTYDCGPHRVRQVREWRQQHPAYWKPKCQPILDSQPTEAKSVNPEQRSRNVPPPVLLPLRDVCLEQNPAFVGLIAMVTGSTLREDIAATTRKLLLQGQNILGLQSPEQPKSS
jgi:hypothetical protein